MSKLSILIIDDENELESIYRAHLNKIDAEVTFSNHPQKAWKNLDKFTYDLIVTDLKMPIISGDELTILGWQWVTQKTLIISNK